jgi:hypothetical protein
VKAGDSLTINYTRFRPSLKGYDSVSLYFVSNALPSLDPEYDNIAFLEGFGIETGPEVEDYNWFRRRVKTLNEGIVKLINEGNTALTVRELAGFNASWHTTGATMTDTLYSPGNHYFIPAYRQYEGKVLQPYEDSETYSYEERVMDIQVFFNPQSEYPHKEGEDDEIVGDCQIVDSFAINFTTESKVQDYNIRSYLRGEAFLPKIEAEGYTWKTSTQLDEESSEIGAVLIKNPSYTSALKVKKVTLLQIDQYQDFDLGNVDKYMDTIVRPSDKIEKDSLVIPVIFTPHSTTPPTRRAYVEIQSDAKDGSGNNGTDVDPTIIDTVELVANAFDVGFVLSPINYNQITRCDAPFSPLHIENLSTTNVLEIYDISVVSKDIEFADLFVQLQEQDTFIVQPESGLDIDFRFDACNWLDDSGNKVEGDIKVEVAVTTNMGVDTTTFEVISTIIPVKLTLPNIPNTAPNTVIEIPINIQIANNNDNFYNFENAKITSFTLKLKTEKKSLFFENDFSSVPNWSFSGSQDATGLLTITGKANNSNAIIEEGAFCKPRLKLLLSTLRDIPLEIVDFDVDDRACCISWSAETGNVHSTTCAQDARGGINTTGTLFSLPPITPNPYTASNLEFQYGIGLDGDATIEIYNSNGELVKSILNGYAKVGEYTANTDISNFSSGAYTIILKAGLFEEKQKLIIVK